MCETRHTFKWQTIGKSHCLKVENNLFGERSFAVTAICLTGITCDHETEVLILIIYLKKYLKVCEHFKYFRKVFKYKYFES